MVPRDGAQAAISGPVKLEPGLPSLSPPRLPELMSKATATARTKLHNPRAHLGPSTKAPNPQGRSGFSV